MQLKPEQLKPLGRRIIVRKYTRPERVGSIWLNPAWRQDNSRSLWEPIAFSEKAMEWFRENLVFAHELEAVESGECILVTAPNRGVHISVIDDPREHYFLMAEEVVKVIPFEEGEDDEQEERTESRVA
jgi:hypothetical protein